VVADGVHIRLVGENVHPTGQLPLGDGTGTGRRSSAYAIAVSANRIKTTAPIIRASAGDGQHGGDDQTEDDDRSAHAAGRSVKIVRGSMSIAAHDASRRRLRCDREHRQQGRTGRAALANRQREDG
jgi:hypothetical protein